VASFRGTASGFDLLDHVEPLAEPEHRRRAASLDEPTTDRFVPAGARHLLAGLVTDDVGVLQLALGEHRLHPTRLQAHQVAGPEDARRALLREHLHDSLCSIRVRSSRSSATAWLISTARPWSEMSAHSSTSRSMRSSRSSIARVASTAARRSSPCSPTRID